MRDGTSLLFKLTLIFISPEVEGPEFTNVIDSLGIFSPKC